MTPMQRSVELWRSLEPRAQITLVGSVVAVLVTAFVLFQLASRPSWTVVASGLSASEGGDVAKSLESAGIAYELRDGGATVLVGKSDVTSARVALAQDGALSGGHAGFELFDKQSLGTTDFQQKVEYQRALEGEIARTIEAVDGVRSAQVRLVLPKQSVFLNDATSASAAVLIQTGGALDGSAVSGIARLVASSVESLRPDDVTITDETGTLIWPMGGGVGAGGDAFTKLQAEQRYDDRLSAQIDAMLTATLGANKALARVHSSLDLDQRKIDTVTYGKKGVPLTSSKDVEALAGSGSTAAGGAAAGVASNVPNQSMAGTAKKAAASGSSNYDHTKGSTSYAVDRSIESRVVAPGSVRKLSVALVLDRGVPASSVAAIKESVANLAGIDEKRGDTISVAQVDLAEPAPATAAPSVLADAGGPLGIARWVLLAIGGAAFLFVVRRGLRRREREPIEADATWLREINGMRPLAELEATQVMPVVRTPGPEALRRQQASEQLDEIVRRQPETVAQQVTQWMRD